MVPYSFSMLEISLQPVLTVNTAFDVLGDTEFWSSLMNNKNLPARDERVQLTIYDVCPELKNFDKESEPFDKPEAGESVNSDRAATAAAENT